jgi:hypothetical protein
MRLVRALLLPFFPTSLTFVGFCTLVLAVTGIGGSEAGVLKIIVRVLVLSYVLKYAYNLLEDAANGMTEPSVATADMLGPFEIRPFLQFVLGIIVWSGARAAGGRAGMAILLGYAFLIPASVGVMAINRTLLDAINPIRLVRTAWAIGWQYLLIWGYIALLAYALELLYATSLWRSAWYALTSLAVLSAFCLTGALIYAHRDSLGFEPIKSPERKAQAAEHDRLKQRALVLDHLYTATRMHDYRRATSELGQWLSAQDAGEMALDAKAVIIQAAQWNSPRGLAELTRCVITHMLQCGRADLALDALAASTQLAQTYAPDSEGQALALAQYARTSGRPHLALKVLENFISRAPGSEISDATRSLLRELSATRS